MSNTGRIKQLVLEGKRENRVTLILPCVRECAQTRVTQFRTDRAHKVSTEERFLRKVDASFGGYLTGTFFCVAKTTVSTPLTATDVRPPWLIALKAYSAGKFRKMTMFTGSTVRNTPCHRARTNERHGRSARAIVRIAQTSLATSRGTSLRSSPTW